MSNCHSVAGGSAQRLPYGRHAVPIAETIDPHNVVANQVVERGDHLAHHRHDGDLRQLASIDPPRAVYELRQNAMEPSPASSGVFFGPREVIVPNPPRRPASLPLRSDASS